MSLNLPKVLYGVTAPEFSLANKPSLLVLNNLTTNMNPNITTARPENDAYNIQHRCLTSYASDRGPHSTSLSPMDNSSLSSEVNYAKHVATNCNMDIETIDPSFPSVKNFTRFSFSLPASNSCVPLEEAPNSVPIGDNNISTEPSPPLVIPYSTNVPADPSLWDGKFTATSFSSTNKFINSDINNITCSLQRMAYFICQRSLENRNANNIRQLGSFGKSAWDFILAIFESSWDVLTTANKSSIRSNVIKEFGKKTNPSPKANI